jgi:RNA polymerase sigma-70 factor, ECF subfamily
MRPGSRGLGGDLGAALRDLPKQQRQAFALRVLGGLSYAAIAVRLGCSSRAASIRVARGLNGLRARMETNQS